MLKAINSFVNLYFESFQLLSRPRVWLVMLLLFVIQSIVLLAHIFFNHPLFYQAVLFWTELVNPDLSQAFAHYPGHFQLLAYYFLNANFWIGFLIEGVLLGWVSLYLYKFIFEIDEKVKSTLMQKLNLWLQLSLGWLLINGLITLSDKYLPNLFSSIIIGSPRRELIFDYLIMPGWHTIIFSTGYFLLSYVAIYKVNFLTGYKQSLKLLIKDPLKILLMSMIVMILPILFTIILRFQNSFIYKFNPEIIIWLLFGFLLISMPVNFIWMASAVLYLADDE